MILSAQSHQYVFYWSDGPPGPDPEPRDGAQWQNAEVAFGSDQQALLFLRRFSALYEFRALLNEKFPGQTYRLGVEAIHAKIADLLARRRLLVIKRWRRATGYVLAVGEATKVPRKEAVQKSEASEPATFHSNHDGASQAEALADASSGGDAFCEECEKALQQQAAPPAPQAPQPPPSFPPDHDGDQQAATLIQASKSGVPFCQECQGA